MLTIGVDGRCSGSVELVDVGSNWGSELMSSTGSRCGSSTATELGGGCSFSLTLSSTQPDAVQECGWEFTTSTSYSCVSLTVSVAQLNSQFNEKRPHRTGWQDKLLQASRQDPAYLPAQDCWYPPCQPRSRWVLERPERAVSDQTQGGMDFP